MEYGQEVHANPDRDRDGYLAVSNLEKEFVGALRDSKSMHSSHPQPELNSAQATAQMNATEIAGKFNLFQKMFSGAVPHLTSSMQGGSSSDARNALTPEERRLYDEAAGRLAAMTQKFVNRDTSQRDLGHGKENHDE